MAHSSRLCICLAALLLLSGCASKYAPQTTTVTYYPDCYAPINKLRQSEKEYNKTVVSGAVAGGLLGAVVGLLATGKMEGAAVGAAVGAGTGAAVGYGNAEKERNKELASFLSELDGDISGLDNVNAAGRLTLQCYDKSFKTAIKDFKGKRLSRAELDARYAEIKAGSAEALSLMSRQADTAREKEANYQAALEEEARQAQRPVPQATAAKSSKSGKKSSSKAPSKAPSKASAQSGDPLQTMADKTQTYSKTRAELDNDISKGNTLQQSWEQDLAAIRS